MEWFPAVWDSIFLFIDCFTENLKKKKNQRSLNESSSLWFIKFNLFVAFSEKLKSWLTEISSSKEPAFLFLQPFDTE